MMNAIRESQLQGARARFLTNRWVRRLITAALCRLTQTAKLILALLAVCPALAAASAPVYRTEANVMVEIALEAQGRHADPFNDLTVDVTFTAPGGKRFRVP